MEIYIKPSAGSFYPKEWRKAQEISEKYQAEVHLIFNERTINFENGEEVNNTFEGIKTVNLLRSES